jgi:hypothetical protein
MAVTTISEMNKIYRKFDPRVISHHFVLR